jgi:hypothetical protein
MENTTDTQRIERRIGELALEKRVLEDTHAFMIRQNQEMNQEFQKQVINNQTRFAQIAGGVAELRKLLHTPDEQPTQKDTNHDNLSPTLNLHNRTADVCPVEQSQDR